MGRPPIGQRAMTAVERQHRYWAKRLAPAAGPPPAADAISLTHLGRHPSVVAALILQRLGRQATIRLRDALTAVLAPKATAEADDPPIEERMHYWLTRSDKCPTDDIATDIETEADDIEAADDDD